MSLNLLRTQTTTCLRQSARLKFTRQLTSAVASTSSPAPSEAPPASSASAAPALSPSSSPSTLPSTDAATNTHYRITLRRSAISLPAKIKGTLAALGLHRRMQTVYQRHTPEAAGMILGVKELVEVHNVPEDAVRTQTEQRRERRAPRGYQVVGRNVTDFSA